MLLPDCLLAGARALAGALREAADAARRGAPSLAEPGGVGYGLGYGAGAAGGGGGGAAVAKLKGQLAALAAFAGSGAAAARVPQGVLAEISRLALMPI